MKRPLVLSLLALAVLASACRERTPTGTPATLPTATETVVSYPDTVTPPPTPPPSATSAAPVAFLPSPSVTPTVAPSPTPSAALVTPLPTLTVTVAVAVPPVAGIPALQGMVLVWHSMGGIAALCQDLALFNNGQVLFGPCGSLSQASLGDPWLAELRAWQAKFAPFECKVEDNPGRPDSLSTSLVFVGQGSTQATDEDKESLVNWARQLYAELSGRFGQAGSQTSAPPATVVVATATPLPSFTSLPAMPSLSRCLGPGFTLFCPGDASVDVDLSIPWVLQGPLVTVRPLGKEWVWSGPAYALEINVYENPNGLSSSRWALEHLQSSWRAAKLAGEPFSGPVNAEGQLDEKRAMPVRMGDKAAFQVDWIAGDHYRRVVYLALPKQTLAFAFDLYPPENNPLAELAGDLYGLLLATVSAPSGEGVAASVSPAQGVKEFVGPGFLAFVPPNAIMEEVEAEHWALIGPDLNICSAEGDLAWQGPAYQVDLVLRENPEKLSAEAWAQRYLLAEWRKAKEAGEPFTGPIDDKGELIPEAVRKLTLGDGIAFQVDWRGVDGVHSVTYVNAASKVLEVHCDLLAEEDYLAAPLTNLLYALLLTNLRGGS